MKDKQLIELPNEEDIQARLQQNIHFMGQTFGTLLGKKTKSSTIVEIEERTTKRQKIIEDDQESLPYLEPPSSPLISLIKSTKNNEEEMNKLKQKLNVRISEMRTKRKADLSITRKKLKLMEQSPLPTASPPRTKRKPDLTTTRKKLKQSLLSTVLPPKEIIQEEPDFEEVAGEEIYFDEEVPQKKKLLTQV